MMGLNKSQKEEVISSTTSEVKRINELLNSAKTRVTGLELLNSFLDNCSDKELTDYCINWMQNCCKVDSSAKNRDFAIQVLGNLFKVSADYPELKKTVSFFITTRFFDYFFKYFLDSEAGWSCAKSCFLFYKGACGPFEVQVTKHLTNQLEKNIKISSTVAGCYALLPCLGGGGNENINYVKNWNTQFLKFINFCHCVLNKLFVNIDELQEYEVQESIFKKADNDLSADFLTVQLFNYCSVLKFMLLNKYPVQKSISIDLLLEMICRGLAINSVTAGKNQTTETIALQKVLPEVHIILHSLLSALIATCKSLLLPYFHLICKLIKQSLKWSDSDTTHDTNKQLESLRVSVYEVLCNWLVAAKSGSCVETISKIVISNALNDIKSKKNVTLLKESKQKNLLEKKDKTKSRDNPPVNTTLCFAALKSLQLILKFLGTSLSAEEHKTLQEVTIKLLSDIQNSSLNTGLPYSDTACRKELYSLLLELVNQPCLNWPPPICFAFRIFAKGQSDPSFTVSNVCSTAINQITNVIHTPFDSPGISVSSQTESTRYGTNLNGINERTEETNTRDEPKKLEKDTRILKEISVDKNLNNVVQEDTSYQKNKISNPSEESDVSSHEDSIITVNYTKSDVDDGEMTKNAIQSEVGETEVQMEVEVPAETEAEAEPETQAEGEAEVEVDVQEEAETEVNGQCVNDLNLMDDEPASKKLKKNTEENSYESNSPRNVKNKTPSPEKSNRGNKASPLTPNKDSDKDSKRSSGSQEDLLKPNKDQSKIPEIRILEDSSSIKSYSPDSSNDESKVRDPRKRYFLRSKTSKENLEEVEELSKDTNSSEGCRTPTPTRTSHRHSLTPFSSKQRPRTRASSRLETVEDESGSKKDDDDDVNIIEVFDDTYVD